MTAISAIFKKLINSYKTMDIEYPRLKPVTIAQWMLESGYGTSKLATEHLNFGGLKWRTEMGEGKLATQVQYQAHDGLDEYCKFASLENFIKGYWRFIERPPYVGWKNHAANGREYIQFIGPIYCPAPNYSNKVLALLPEAERFLEGSEPVPRDEMEPSATRPAIGSAMYEVRFYTGEYKHRQEQANEAKAVAYVEHHFNSSSSSSANYAVVVTGSNASTTSRNWGRWYAHAVAKEFGTKVSGDNGLLIGGWEGRGDGNLRYTKMPAILLEPLFASNPQQADIIRSDSGQTRLARVLVESIQRFFPDGGLIVFSVGHKYKTSNPRDLGAALAGGGWEAEFAEKVLLKAKAMLEQVVSLETGRRIRVMKGDKEILNEVIDEDDELVWDPVRGLLQIIDPS